MFPQKLLFTLAFVLLYFPSFSQKNFTTENSRWHRGQIYLKDGSILTGDLNYNFITEVLSIKKATTAEPYSPRSVIYFLFFDGRGSEIKFFSLPFFSLEHNRNVYAFFEVVYENYNFALLSRHEYHYAEHHSGGYDNIPFNSWEVEKVTEKIYLANSAGYIVEYALADKDKNSTYWTRWYAQSDKNDSYTQSKTSREADLKYRVTDRSALLKIFKNKYPIISKYIQAQNLRLNTIEELVQVINYAESL